MLDVYKNIKERRKELGMTQTDLALKVGYSEKSAIAKVEKGKVDLPLSKLKEISEALETTPSELMGDLPDLVCRPDDDTTLEIEIKAAKMDDYHLQRLLKYAELLIQSQNKIDIHDDF